MEYENYNAKFMYAFYMHHTASEIHAPIQPIRWHLCQRAPRVHTSLTSPLHDRTPYMNKKTSMKDDDEGHVVTWICSLLSSLPHRSQCHPI